jgi:hypothetical protein
MSIYYSESRDERFYTVCKDCSGYEGGGGGTTAALLAALHVDTSPFIFSSP